MCATCLGGACRLRTKGVGDFHGKIGRFRRALRLKQHRGSRSQQNDFLPVSRKGANESFWAGGGAPEPSKVEPGGSTLTHCFTSSRSEHPPRCGWSRSAVRVRQVQGGLHPVYSARRGETTPSWIDRQTDRRTDRQMDRQRNAQRRTKRYKRDFHKASSWKQFPHNGIYIPT